MGWDAFRSRRQLDWLTSRPIAHRGLHNLSAGIPENTLIAFDEAIKRSLPIEFDVRLTEDGKAVVYHDHNLSRLTGVDREVAGMKLHDIQRLRIGNTEERPPSMDEALEFICGRVPVLIEIKSQGRPGALESKVMRALDHFPGQAAVQSFSPRSMQWFRENAPSIIRGQIAGAYLWRDLTTLQSFFHRHLLILRISRPAFVAHQLGCLGLPASRLWRRLGGPLLAWTAKNTQDYAKARSRADGVIFEGFDPLKSIA